MTQNIPLASKPRYEILDGLRGVAALMVVFFHFGETYAMSPETQYINHGYLAVDFFFILSGFVIGYAYDDRWDKMSLWGFFKRRLIRLQPMVIMGTIVGAAFYGFGQCEGFPQIGNVEWWKVALAFVMGLLMIPCGKGLDIRGWGETNSFNGPNWTLTWEYLANILYALVFRFLPKWGLALLVVAAGVCTFDISLDLDLFGLITERRASHQYSVIGGWSLTAEQIYVGLTRLFCPFLMGMLLSRIGKYINVKRGFLWCSLIIVAVLSLPYVGAAPSIWNGIYNILAIVVIFPIIVLMGAGSTIKSERSGKICTFLGEISYPLYLTHYPILYAHMAWVWSHPDAPRYLHIVMGIGTFLLAIGVAYACLRLYDIPVRKWLTEKLNRSKNRDCQ